MIKRQTPLLTVNSIEASLPFWAEGLGYEVTMSVPGETGLGFAALARDGQELMLQTTASVREDLPAVVERLASSMLFVEVESLEEAMTALAAFQPVFSRRTTFYGSVESLYEDADGHFVLLAEFPPEQE